MIKSGCRFILINMSVAENHLVAYYLGIAILQASSTHPQGFHLRTDKGYACLYGFFDIIVVSSAPISHNYLYIVIFFHLSYTFSADTRLEA
jgi:hypothetical protein